jgi:hypothetical protein
MCDMVLNVQAIMTDYKADEQGDILLGARECKILQDKFLEDFNLKYAKEIFLKPLFGLGLRV